MTLIARNSGLRGAGKLMALVGLSLVGSAAAGCVSSEKYNARGLQGSQLTEQLATAQRQNSELAAQNEMYKGQLAQIRNAGDNKEALYANQLQTINDLQRQRDELAEKYRQSVDSFAKQGSGALPVMLTNELTAFAAQNPDQVEFDASRGLVKFKSDFTFSAGSAELVPEAKGAIARLASILNGAVASNYDLMVVGHTDAKPVSNPATIKAGHRDNWYLSAHRAIEVSRELRQQKVASNRMQIAGFGAERPVPNTDANSPAGMAKNRRVEVLLLPTSHAARTTMTADASSTGEPVAPAAAARPAGIAQSGDNKDSGRNDGGGTVPANPVRPPDNNK